MEIYRSHFLAIGYDFKLKVPKGKMEYFDRKHQKRINYKTHHLFQDDFANRCGCENYPLLRTINRVLRNYSVPDPGCDIKATPGSSVRFIPNPVYGAPWIISPPQPAPFTSVFYPTVYSQNLYK